MKIHKNSATLAILLIMGFSGNYFFSRNNTQRNLKEISQKDPLSTPESNALEVFQKVQHIKSHAPKRSLSSDTTKKTQKDKLPEIFSPHPPGFIAKKRPPLPGEISYKVPLAPPGFTPVKVDHLYKLVRSPAKHPVTGQKIHN